MDGGVVSLGTEYLEHKAMRGHYRYNCVWQLKPPPPNLDLIVYLRVIDMDLTDEGKLLKLIPQALCLACTIMVSAL